MRNFNCDPEEFLRFVHDIDFRNLKKSDSLRKKINFLPEKKSCIQMEMLIMLKNC